MKRLFTEKEVREIIGGNENYLDYLCIWRDNPDINSKEVKLWHEKRNQLRQEQLAILEKMRGEGK